mmetsp:Transcript_25795/g.43040  ORF Transcript_25795/g.43040 Transcript_25795/m.43040 type:complete len:85 (+) Transcript_25795:76-330(+)
MFGRLSYRNTSRLTRRFYAGGIHKTEVKPKTHAKNVGTAVLLLSFVVGVYYSAIRKMQYTDELEKLIEEDNADKKESVPMIKKK